MKTYKICICIAFCVNIAFCYPAEQSKLSLYPKKEQKTYGFGESDERGRNSKSPYQRENNALYYLNKDSKKLTAFYDTLAKNSQNKQYAHFRSRTLIEHNAYNALDNAQKKSLHNALVLSRFYPSGFMKYSELGGIGISGKLSVDDDAKPTYFHFDSRYFSDLELLREQENIMIYAMCVLPRFDNCILFGIGEEW